MPDEDDTAAERMQQADENLADAEKLLSHGFYGHAVHVAYYAAFHAAMALLALEGRRPKTHHGVISEIARRFVQSGRLPKDAAALLEQALQVRLRADYGVLTPVSAEEARAGACGSSSRRRGHCCPSRAAPALPWSPARHHDIRPALPAKQMGKPQAPGSDARNRLASRSAGRSHHRFVACCPAGPHPAAVLEGKPPMQGNLHV